MKPRLINFVSERLSNLLFCLFFIASGLFIRSGWITISSEVSPYLGDIIWGTMVFFFFGTLWPKLTVSKRILAAIIFSYLIEFSQLLKYDWIEQLRQYKIIALVIGYGYQTSDLICYTIGIILGYLIYKLQATVKPTLLSSFRQKQSGHSD